MLRYYKQKHHFINFFCKYSHLFAFGFKKFATALHFFMPLALSATTSLLQNVSICPNMSQNVSKCLKINSIFLKTHFETFWDILRHFEHFEHFEQFWAILSNFEQFWADFWAGMRHFETFWIDFEQFWAILSGFLGQVWDILRHFELILSNFEQFWAIFWAILSNFERFWAILSGICSASNLYIWIVLSIYMSFLHNWNSQIMEIEARS